jgi:phage terminase small subunit
MEKKLTLKQKRFAREYIKTGNGTQSAIKAGYSEKTAKEMAYENLTKPHIKSKIELTMSKEAEKLGITAEYVLNNIKNIAEHENEKFMPTKLKANELLARHLQLLHENEHKIDIVKDHQDRQKQIEELE